MEKESLIVWSVGHGESLIVWSVGHGEGTVFAVYHYMRWVELHEMGGAT